MTHTLNRYAAAPFLLSAAVLLAGGLAWAQSSGTASPSGSTPGAQMHAMHAADDTGAQARKAKYQSMMADLQAPDQQLEGLVAKMNAATGEAKVDAMAEVVNTLVSQRSRMHAWMTAMQSDMMHQMMAGHGTSGHAMMQPHMSGGTGTASGAHGGSH